MYYRMVCDDLYYVMLIFGFWLLDISLEEQLLINVDVLIDECNLFLGDKNDIVLCSAPVKYLHGLAYGLSYRAFNAPLLCWESLASGLVNNLGYHALYLNSSCLSLGCFTNS